MTASSKKSELRIPRAGFQLHALFREEQARIQRLRNERLSAADALELLLQGFRWLPDEQAAAMLRRPRG